MKQSNRPAATITFDGLTFVYPGMRDPAVSDVSVEADAGRVVALVGPSGCGKSTLLRLVAGLLEPTDGRLLIDGADTTRLRPEHRHVGWVPQGYALFDHLDVSGNVAFGLRMRKVPKADRTDRVKEALALCRISELADRPVNDLSGGQRQRVAIARALATRPRVLLLDEPLAALDPQLRRALRADLAALLRASGVTSLLVTHDQTEALAMADKVAVLRDGRVEQFGTPEELWTSPTNTFVAEFVGSATVVEAEAVSDTRVRLAPGLEIDVAASVEAGSSTLVALRASDLAATPGGTALEVLTREFVGDSWLVTGQLKGGPVVTYAAHEDAEPGDIVHVGSRPGVRVTVVGR